MHCCSHALTRTRQLWGQHWRPEEAHCCSDRNTTSKDCVKEMVSLWFPVPLSLTAAAINITKTVFWLSYRYTIFKDHVTLGDCILWNCLLQLLLLQVVKMVWCSKCMSQAGCCTWRLPVQMRSTMGWTWSYTTSRFTETFEIHFSPFLTGMHTTYYKKTMIHSYQYCEERVFLLSIVTYKIWWSSYFLFSFFLK